MRKKIVIMGAAGRDFHNFNLVYSHDKTTEVVAFTAAQIPFIDERLYPPELSGPLYPKGIPIRTEDELAHIIQESQVDEVVFSYSDVTFNHVMEKASTVLSLGADFTLLGPDRTMLDSAKPVLSITAVRTGCGKSAVTRFAAAIIEELGYRAAVIRHPMPYGDLAAQAVQRFASYGDLKSHNCTIEEMEEYEPIIEAGFVVFAGVDYKAILKEAEKEADIIIWDGGNNDMPFIRPDHSIVIVDPLRPGDEANYHPGATNLLMADTVVINKAESAAPDDIDLVLDNINAMNPCALIVETRSLVTVEDVETLPGKKVLVIEDGPTLTHGGMKFGAGIKAAELAGAIEVDPRPYAVGAIAETLRKYPELNHLIPAMGYSRAQIADLEETINATPCDAVLIATPIDLSKIIDIQRPSHRVSYKIEDMEDDGLEGAIARFADEIFK